MSRLTKAFGGHLEGFTRVLFCAVLNPVMFHSSCALQQETGNLALLLDRLARVSTRPRYAFMVLNLIAEAADARGTAGPYVLREGVHRPLRDWLAQSLTSMGARDARRLALADRVREELFRDGGLPEDPDLAGEMVTAEVRERALAAGKSNLSRAVSELVRAGLLQRYYAGNYVDHHNRGGQRHAVYSVTGAARCLLGRKASPPSPERPQGELLLH